MRVTLFRNFIFPKLLIAKFYRAIAEVTLFTKALCAPSSFLFLHYSDQSAHKSEEDHEDLPLFQMSNVVTLLIMQELPVFAFIAQDITQIAHQHFLDQTYSFTRIGGIFQPPRLA